MDSLKNTVYTLYYEAKFNDLFSLVSTVQVNEPHYWELQLLRFRAIQESGKFSEANQFLKYCIYSLGESPIKYQFQLWEIYSDVFINTPFVIDVYLNRLDELHVDANDCTVEALRLGLKARLIELGISLGLLSSLRKKEAIELHTAASNLYAISYTPEEQLLTNWRIINLLRNGPDSDAPRAKKLLKSLIEQAEACQFNRLLIDAKLLVASLNFDDAILAETLNFADVNQEYGQIEEDCNRLGLADYAPNVYFSVGSLLLDYGFDSGISLLHEAIDGFKATNNFTQQQQAWRNIARWYMLCGDEAENIKAEAEVNKLNSEVTLQLSNDIESLYSIFVAQKQGDSAYIYSLLENTESPHNQWTTSHYLTLKANTLITTGRRSEGLALLKEIVNRYALIDINPFHSEALFNLSNVLIGEHPAEAIQHLQEAIRIDEVLEDHYALAQRYQQLASHTFFSQKPNYRITTQIEAYFKKAFDSVARSKKLDYLIQLGNLFQTQGQLYGLVSDYAKAGEFLTKAENVFTNLGTKPQLAFTLSQQGLLLIKIAREFKNLSSFDDALGRFTEAATLFRSCSLYTSLWRTIFHQALCQYEKAQYIEPEDPDFLDYLEQAELFFKEAALLVDELRFVSDNRSGLAKQAAVSSFGGDKQELYLQAFYANFWLKKDYINALRWLERMKSQSFLEEIAAQQVTIKRTKTYDDYKALLDKAASVDDPAMKQEIYNKMEELFTNLFNYSTIEKNEGYVDPIADYTTIRNLIEKEEQTLQGRRLVVIQYFCTPTLTVAFGIRSDWEEPKFERIPLDYETLLVTAKRLFQKPKGGRSLLDTQTDRFLDSFGQSEISDVDLEADWLPFSHLVSPVTNWAVPNDLVCFIPHGILHDLPLHTLQVSPRQYLIERNPVFYSPSLSMLAISLRRPTLSVVAEPVVFGNPTLDLPFAEEEAQFVAQQLGGQPFLRELATKDKWMEKYSNSGIMHFAGHGNAQANNGLDQYIVFANQERISAREIFSLHTQADLIVLSGCETGLNEYQAGDELFGMVRSMLHSGANAILVSQWAVKDKATALLLMQFYQYYPKHHKAISLQMAMKHLLTDGYGFSNWGAFVLIGRF